KVVHLVTEPLNPNHLPTIHNILMTTTGKMLVASNHGLFRIEEKGKQYEEHLIPETTGIPIFHMLIDSKGYIWASSNSNTSIAHSLFRLSPDAASIELFEASDSDPYRFGGGKVDALIESHTGLVWIGTEKNGVYRGDLNARPFRIIDNFPDRGLYISNNEVYSIYEDDYRQLYIGTKTELNRINLEDGSTTGFGNQLDLKRNVTWEYSSQFPANLVGVLEPTTDGRIWMGAFDYKIGLYDPARGRFLNFHLNEQDSTAFPLWSLRSICVTRDGHTYFGGTALGLCKLRDDGLSFELFPVVATGKSNGTNDGHIQYIYEDSEGILWLGTLNGGLNRYDPQSGAFTHFENDPSNPSSLSNNRVRCILEPGIQGEDILWIATYNGGLNRFDKQSGTFTAYTMDDGLPSNTVHGILEDKVGALWLSTNKGLAQFDPVTEEFSIYSTQDGLLGTEFNEGAFFKNKKGIMYFGGTKGLNYFDPEEIGEKPEYNTPVIFTGFSISGREVLPLDTVNGRVVLSQTISTTNEISLTHRERFISFEFVSLDMAAAGKIRYRYMLDGFDDSWNEVDASHRYISYTNIPSGQYTLMVMGTNSEGTKFREPTEILLNILPPFWQRPFFRLLMAFFIILVFLLILQIRTNVLKNQKKNLEREVEQRTHDLKEANRLLADHSDEIQRMAELLHESDQMKLKFFTNISHEFRTPLTLILGPTEKLLNQEHYLDVPAVKQELELMYRNERRLFKLINQLLEVRRVETGNLRLAVTEDDLLTYLKNIHLLFMPYAEKKSINFTFKSKEEHVRVLFDADKMERIFYNLLSNAFKYTPAGGKIVFSVERVKEAGEWIKITVEDNGTGIGQEHLPYVFDRFYQITNKHQSARISSGIGLSLSRDLVLKHHGLIEVHSELGKGSRFEVLIPENREVYKKNEILVEPETDLSMEYISAMLETYEYTSSAANDTPLVGEDLFRILLVEDNLDMQKFLYNEMSSYYNVMLAQNGEEGLLVAGLNLPDLIISDIMMPVMDGLEFCKKIKEDEATSHIPVILLTARSGTESELSGFESGADDYITKPFNPEILKLKIRNILEARKLLADKFSESASYIPENIKISQIDQGFLEKFVKIVEDNIDDSELSGDRLACELGMSKGNLYKKLKTLSGMTVNIYIRTIRLKIAARLLKQGTYNISEVAYSVGFNNPKYFSTCFSEMFKVSPKEYMK
ncbi:MAG: response regulator, partial [Bacteroidales bacterium]